MSDVVGFDATWGGDTVSAVDLERFYQDNYRSVLVLVYSLLGDWRVAEDVAQESFVAVCRHRGRLERHARPDLWVRRVTINRATAVLRRRVAERRANRRVGTPDVAAVPSDLTWLLEMIGTLPKRQASAFSLVHIAQCTISEAAETMGCSESTVRTHLERARSSLRAAITAMDGDGTTTSVPTT